MLFNPFLRKLRFLLLLVLVLLVVNFGHVRASEESPPADWQLQGILAALDDPDPDVWAAALEEMSEYDLKPVEISSERVEQIGKLLSHENWRVRSAAARAVGEMGAEAKDFIPQLLQFLMDENSVVREAAAQAVVKLGAEDKDLIPQLLQLLMDENSDVREEAAKAVGKIGQLNTQQILPILNAAHRNRDKEATLRFLAYFVSGGEYDALTLIQWLGSPEQYPYQIDKFKNERPISHEEGKKVLELFAEVWKPSQSLEYLPFELERQINIVVKKVDWQPEDLPLLKKHYNNLKDEDINAKIVSLQGIQWFSYLWKFLLLHAFTWLILLCLYPKSPEIQTLFWHPQIRKIAGLGYIGL